MIRPLLIVYFVFCVAILYGQQLKRTINPSTDVADEDDQPGLLVGVDYASRVIFCGRDFGERQSGISPYLLLNSGKGLYAYAINDYWKKTPHRPARTVLGAGYEADLTNSLTFFTGYERWINHYGDLYLNNALENEFEAGFRFSGRAITIEPVFYYMWGLEKIYQLDVLIEKESVLTNFNNGKITLTPGALFTFATPVFSYIFYEFPDENYDYEKFRFVDTEASLALTVELGNLELGSSVLFNVPINVGNENLSPFFYYTLSASYNFRF